jgi:hypothetical protein
MTRALWVIEVVCGVGVLVAAAVLWRHFRDDRAVARGAQRLLAMGAHPDRRTRTLRDIHSLPSVKERA